MSSALLLLTRLAINALALVAVDQIFDRISFDTWYATVAAAILLGFVNAWLRPVVTILTLPLTIITLGLFTLVINGLMLALVSWVLPGFHLEGFWTAVGAALVISIVSTMLNWFVRPRRGAVIRH